MSRPTAHAARPATVLAVLVCGLLLASAAPALAQRRPPPGGGGPPGAPIALSLSPAAIAFSTPGVAEFDAGRVDSPPITITIEPVNRVRPWQLYLESASPDFGGYGKPLETLLVRTEATGWAPVSQVSQPIATGTGPQTVVLFFRVLLDWALDEPGSYGAALAFDAAHP